MSNLKERVASLKGKVDEEKGLIDLYHIYRKEFGLTHFEILKEPIPCVLGTLHVLTENVKTNKGVKNG